MPKYLKQILITTIAIILTSCVLYLQYGREMDVSGSYYFNDTLSFNVTLNRLWFKSSDQKAIERNILKKYNENSFHSTMFSTDLIHPKKILISVYLNKYDIGKNKPLFTFSADT